MTTNSASFLSDGFCILRHAIEPSLADQIVNEIKNAASLSFNVGMLRRHLVIANPENIQNPKFRYRDLYVNSGLIRQAVFSGPIINFLSEQENSPILAFQNIGFVRGSGQRIHRDSNYVDISGLNAGFYGCWIALEDISEGAGELVYYPGSHLLPAYHFAEKSTHWVVSRDGIYANEACHDWLEKQMADHGIQPQRFLANKGDCIIWHGDLVHAGSPIHKTERTRYSLVTHFCGIKSQPRYLQTADKNQIIPFNERCYFSSAHYDLSDIKIVDALENKPVRPKIREQA